MRSGDEPREPRLAALLERIKADDSVSYKAFGGADELADRLAESWTCSSASGSRPASTSSTVTVRR